MYTEGYLREGKNQQHLISRFIRLLLILVVIYALNYIVLLLLPLKNCAPTGIRNHATLPGKVELLRIHCNPIGSLGATVVRAKHGGEQITAIKCPIATLMGS